MDSVESALGGADAAADAAVFIDHRRAATQTAGCLGAHLLLRKRERVFAELVSLLGHSFHLTGRVVVTLHHDVVLVELDEVAAVASDGEVTVLHVAVQRFGTLLAGGDGVDGELRTSEAVAAHEDVLFGGLVGQLVGHGIDAAHELHFRVLEQILEDDRLTDGEDDQVGIQRNRFFLIVLRRKTVIFVIHGGAFLEDDAGDLVGT